MLAAAGYGSRREIEDWIRAGRIRVSGEVAELGQTLSGDEAVLLDGRPIKLPGSGGKHRHLMYNKPAGEICSRRDRKGRPLVFDALPKARDGRWISIGRLDVNTTGLLLFTTDGALANALMHPSNEVARRYAVRVHGRPGKAALAALTEGVTLADGHARSETLEAGRGDGSNRWYHVMLREGRNREVRRLWEAVGCRVSRLIRTGYGTIDLPRSLDLGRWQDLSPAEVRELYDVAGLGEQPNP